MTMKDDGFFGGICCGIFLMIFCFCGFAALTSSYRTVFVDSDKLIVEYKEKLYKLTPVEKIYVKPAGKEKPHD